MKVTVVIEDTGGGLGDQWLRRQLRRERLRRATVPRLGGCIRSDK